MNCIFCKIVAGDLPCYKVYEDDNVIAFLDIAPVNYGHTLVIPKKHYEDFEEIPEDKLFEVMKVVKIVGKKIKAGLNVEGYNVIENDGLAAGQIVPHIHFHIIPRKEGDGLSLWPHGKYGDDEADEILKKIRL